MDNTQNGAIEPIKIIEVDLREVGQAAIYGAGGTNYSEVMDLAKYREMIASGKIDVDGANFITNVDNVVNTENINVDIPLVANPVKSDIPVKLKYARMFLFTVCVAALTVMFVFHPALAMLTLTVVFLFLSNTNLPDD